MLPLSLTEDPLQILFAAMVLIFYIFCRPKDPATPKPEKGLACEGHRDSPAQKKAKSARYDLWQLVTLQAGALCLGQGVSEAASS